MIKLKYKLSRPLEHFFSWLADWAEHRRWRFSICPDCGRNRYYGKPCKGVTRFEKHGG
jgi:hypothetical protein